MEWGDVCRNTYDGDVYEKVLIFLILRGMVLLIDGDFLNNFCECGQDETNIVEHPVWCMVHHINYVNYINVC